MIDFASKIQGALDKSQTLDDLAVLVARILPEVVLKRSRFARKNTLRACVNLEYAYRQRGDVAKR